MRYLELTLPTIHSNLALDEALLLRAEQGGPELLRIWEWPTPAVVLGAACRWQHDVNEAACTADHVPLARRSSGGGTVLLGAGCLLFTLVLNYETAPELRVVRPSYRWILDRVRHGLTTSTEIRIEGISDLTVDGRKISGNAQQRKRGHLLHHGSILHAFEIAALVRYLHFPERAPEYRQSREHADFVTNLALPRSEIIGRLRTTWGAENADDAPPLEAALRLATEKYEMPSWILRR